MFQWRRFAFFDKEELSEDGKPLPLFKKFKPTCSTSGRGQLVYGDASGTIRLVNRDFEERSFRAYESEVIALHQLKRSNVLVSIGSDVSNTTIKIWRLDATDGDGNPALARSLKVFSAKFPQVRVTCFAVLEDLSQLAIGLGNGAVMLFDGSLLRDRNCKQTLLQREGPIVMGMHFREDPQRVSLYVVTADSVLSIFTRQKGQPTVTLDHQGSGELMCSVLTEERSLVVARSEAVYFYEPEERGVCFGFEGEKVQVGWFNNYLYLVCVGERDIRRNTLTFYDLKNKFIAFAATLDPISNITSEWGALFVATTTQRVYQLTEKDLPSKMEMLFRKNLYSIAISLANSQDCDKSYVMDIFQRYGDHLYGKGDFDGAMAQYLETIKYVEPSYVIRKFLDAQRIHNLTRYLQALHEKGRATTDHTTLLLNCYTKLKAVEKLDQFIKSESGLSFDVDTAIRVCRQATYYEHALYLAQKHSQHSLYLKIQLEDEQNFQDALAYVSSLPFDQALEYTNKYGKKLAEHLPDQTCRLLKRLCTEYTPTPLPSSPVTAVAAANAPSQGLNKADPEHFIHFFVGEPARLEDFLEAVKDEPHSGPTVHNTLLELYLRTDFHEDDPEEGSGLGADGALDDKHPRHEKIMNLLKAQGSAVDPDQALVLCKMFGFERGVLYLLGKLKLYREIVQQHMEKGQHGKIIKACKKYGDNDPNLWVEALGYFADHPDPCEEEIGKVLASIERQKLLPPLMIVQTLSRSRAKPLSVVKDCIVRTLQTETRIIEEDQLEIRRYREDTRSMRKEIEALTTRPTTFQGVKCSACTSGLSLPAVHFLCMHSFHQRCVPDNDKECPLCAPEYRKVTEIKANMRQSAGQHDQFLKQLEDSTDGFSTVAEYFGRGIFDEQSKGDSGAAALAQL